MPAYFMVCPLKFMQNFGSGSPLSGVKLIVLLIFVRLIPDTFSSARASLVGQLVKNPPAMQESWVRSLGWEDPLEKEMATHSSTLAWRIPWTEERDRLQSMDSQRVAHECANKFHFHLLAGTATWSRLILCIPIPVPEESISPKSPGSFIGERH